jgi:membrane protein YqaA with SNARE-associated domain
LDLLAIDMQKSGETTHWYTMGKMRRLYAWILKWAHTKYSSWVMFMVAFAESTFFPIPPDAVLLVLGIGNNRKALWWAAVGTAGSVMGGIVGYYIGLSLFDIVGERIILGLGLESEFQRVGELFTNNAFLTIVGAAFTPIPYKVFTIGAGFWRIDLFTFALASLIGRGTRFFIEGFLLYFFGKRIAWFIEKYLGWVSLAVFALLVGVIIVLRLAT